MTHIDPHKFPSPDISEKLARNKKRYEIFNRLVLMMYKLDMDIIDNSSISDGEKARTRQRMVSTFSYDMSFD